MGEYNTWDKAASDFLLLRRFDLYVDMPTLMALNKAGLVEFEREGQDLLLVTRFEDVLEPLQPIVPVDL